MRLPSCLPLALLTLAVLSGWQQHASALRLAPLNRGQHQQQQGELSRAGTCEPLASEADCSATNGCTWCASESRAACFPSSQTTFLPSEFKCGNAAARAAAGSASPPECSSHKDDVACDNDSACTWCTSSFGWDKGSCFELDQAKYLPKQMFDCDSDTSSMRAAAAASASSSVSSSDSGADAHEEDDGKQEHGSGRNREEEEVSRAWSASSACMKLKTEDDCADGDDCTWCTSSFLGKGACFTKSAAAVLPPQMFDCSAEQASQQGSAKTLDSVEDVTAVATAAVVASVRQYNCTFRDKADCDVDGVCVWCIGDFSSYGICYDRAASTLLPTDQFQCDYGDDTDTPARRLLAVEQQQQPEQQQQQQQQQAYEAFYADGGAEEDAGREGRALLMVDTPAAVLQQPKVQQQQQQKSQGVGKSKGQQVTDRPKEQHLGGGIYEYADEGAVEEKKEAVTYRLDCEEVKDDVACDDDPECSWCISSFLDPGACFPVAVAKYLPPQMFTCENLPGRRITNSVCDKLSEGECAAPSCVWCTSAAVGGGCFTPEEAAKLPSAIFNCKTAPQ